LGKEKEETSNGTEQEGERGGRPARIGGRGDGGWRRESGREDSKKGSTSRTEDRKKQFTAGEKGNGGGRRKEREREEDRHKERERQDMKKGATSRRERGDKSKAEINDAGGAQIHRQMHVHMR